MAERPPFTSEAELEQALVELGRRVAFPATPMLVGSVRGRIATETRRRRGPVWSTIFTPRSRRWAVALAVLLLLAATLALSPAARRAIADRLGLRGLVIHFLPSAPTPLPTLVPSPTGAPTPSAAPLGARLGWSRPVSLAHAQSEVPYTIRQPSLLGEPDEVYLGQPQEYVEPTDHPDDVVHLVYSARPDLPATAETGVGLLLTQFQGTDAAPEFGKGIPDGTDIVAVRVNGKPGYWIEGEPHVLLSYRNLSGDHVYDEGRLAGNTLVWEDGDLTLRLEAAVDEDTALRIAKLIH